MTEAFSQLSPARALEAARRRLLETGTRNRLIHVNRANSRANSLSIINEQADAVYALLRGQGRRMRFRATGRDRPGDDEGEALHLAVPDPDPAPSADRLTDSILDTPLGPEALARRLLRLASDARTAEEEQGINILFLAVGFLRWRESSAPQRWREAPLILLPVQLVRNERGSTFDLVSREEDLSTNLPLAERLRQEFGITLPEIDETEDWRPSKYFAEVAEAVAGQPGWSIDADGMQLGFFSFAKLLMHRDLDPASWPGESLAANPLLRGLLVEGFPGDEPLFPEEGRLDELLDPAEIIQVVDADASQTKVIEEVRRGANLVVQGPPGTGKSQTITNIIAAAVHDGKSVLFVAEKMAALSVVHDRLVRAGLRDICIELHSRTANKRAFAEELGRTLAASAEALPEPGDAAALRETRDELNRIAALLHTPLPPTGDSPFGALSEIIGFMGAGARPPAVPLEGLESLDRSARAAARQAIRAFVAALERAGPPAAHPFRGTAALDLQPTDLVRLADELSRALSALDALQAEAARLAAALGREAPASMAGTAALAASVALLAEAPPGAIEAAAALWPHLAKPRLTEALSAGADWAEARRRAEPRFSAAAWGADPSALRPAIVAGQGSLWARLFGGYRRASAGLAGLLAGPLPKSPAERLALLDELAELRRRRLLLADEEPWLGSALGELWRGERTPFAELLRAAGWLRALREQNSVTSAEALAAASAALPDPASAAAALTRLLETCRAAVAAPLARLRFDLAEAGIGPDLEGAELAGLRAALGRMAAEGGRYAEWAGLQRATAAARRNGAGRVVDAVLAGGLEPQLAEREFAFACAEARWNAARQRCPELDALAGLDRHALVRRFRELERERIESTRSLILSRHYARMPRGSMGEMGIIRGEIARQRRHRPIRWVMSNAGSMVQRIKPVMLMSPISVAQFLPPGSVSFDLLVIDEASQVRPEDALGAIARARQIVVVGDRKQLPPTSFFERLVDEAELSEEEEEAPAPATAAEMESILSLCEARGLRRRMLEWHYRSRDPSLIRVSNAEFYEDRLVLPPSPLQLDPDYGLKFTRVPGVYARGGSGLGRQGTNRIEAEAVVAAIAAHARNWPELSLGVVAFSRAQAELLIDVLEMARRGDPVLDAFLREERAEAVFVKNIENVQGDERDVILISVAYGPQEPNGRLPSMNFGPVNAEGGERRLNVLFTRARVRCEVFASFDPGDIDPDRTSRAGPRVLKRFLEFAKAGIAEEHAPSGLDHESPFEADVAAVIRSLGYHVDPQVGSAGFRIDLAVRHPERPGQYLLAVECDGAEYHAALWARERDRLRQEILEGLGWRFHRIWSTDWFHERAQEIARLRAALEEARISASRGPRVRGANAAAPPAPPPAAVPPLPAAGAEIGHLTLSAPAYRRAELTLHSELEPHEVPTEELAGLVGRIVAIEGPIHIDEIARRIASAYGRARAGARIVEAAGRAARLALKRDPSLRREGDFLATAAQAADPPVRDRSAETGTLLRAAYLPPSEILAAARLIRRESGEMAPGEMTRAVARLLGFRRVGPDLSARITGLLRETADA